MLELSLSVKELKLKQLEFNNYDTGNKTITDSDVKM